MKEMNEKKKKKLNNLRDFSLTQILHQVINFSPLNKTYRHNNYNVFFIYCMKFKSIICLCFS